MKTALALAAAALAAVVLITFAKPGVTAPPPQGPAAILAKAPAGDWADIDANDLLVIDFARGGRVVIALADNFAPVHIANMRTLARAHWYDGLAVDRVQDNYVTQWGDADGKKPLPVGLTVPTPAEYTRPAAGLAFEAVPYPDPYAPHVGVSGAFPVAEGGDEAWLTHCYGMVGVGRDLNPDTGTGAELYTVIGQPPRGLDRNIAVVGRVVSGMELLSALPRGTADLGFYADPAQRVPFAKVRLAADLDPADRPHIQVLKADSASFHAWMRAKVTRQDTFFVRPPGALDLCNAMPPVRTVK